MNCKQGDMAMIVKSWAGHEGKIVTCLQLLGNENWITPNGDVFFEPTWEIDRFLLNAACVLLKKIPDSQLIPIRPEDLNETEDDRKEVTA